MASDEKANEEQFPGPAVGCHRCWSARIVIRVYRLTGMDITPLIANERRFNVLARICVVAGTIGLLGGIGGLVAALYALTL